MVKKAHREVEEVSEDADFDDDLNDGSDDDAPTTVKLSDAKQKY